MHPPRRRSLDPRAQRSRLTARTGLAWSALILLTGCSSGDDDQPLTTTTNVEVCVSEDPSRTQAAVVEVRQDGEVVGTVELQSAGTAGVQVPPGPVEAYVDGELVGSGDLGENGSITFSCTAPTSTSSPTQEP